MESTFLVAIAAVAALVVAALVIRRKSGALSRDANESASELQSFLAACVEDLRQALDRDGMSAEAKRTETNAILARMESRNSEGHLDAFIQDNRESVDLALRRGDAA